MMKIQYYFYLSCAHIDLFTNRDYIGWQTDLNKMKKAFQKCTCVSLTALRNTSILVNLKRKKTAKRGKRNRDFTKLSSRAEITARHETDVREFFASTTIFTRLHSGRSRCKRTCTKCYNLCFMQMHFSVAS